MQPSVIVDNFTDYPGCCRPAYNQNDILPVCSPAIPKMLQRRQERRFRRVQPWQFINKNNVMKIFSQNQTILQDLAKNLTTFFGDSFDGFNKSGKQLGFKPLIASNKYTIIPAFHQHLSSRPRHNVNLQLILNELFADFLWFLYLYGPIIIAL